MDYKDYISYLRKNRINKHFLNSDSDKRKTVYLELLKNAKSHLRFFAGNLSDEITNSEEFVEGISDFIENKGKLEIILNKFDESVARNSNLYKRLAFYASRGYNISVMKTPIEVTIKLNEKDTPVNFAVSDTNAYRLEVDVDKRNALCNMNDEEFSQKLIDTFHKLSSNSQTIKVDLIDLFSLKPNKKAND